MAGAAKKVNMINNDQKKALWSASRAKGLSKEDLYSIISDVSKKEHMTELTYVEAAMVLDRVNNKKHQFNPNKRTDEGGNSETVALRQKIYRLTEQLGWNDNNNRINGFIKANFKVETIQWLSKAQCMKLIEMLKKMIER